MKIAIVSDAWRPQVNGVVTTLVDLCAALQHAGHDVLLIEPSAFRRLPLPGYGEIELAWRPGRRVRAMLEAGRPDAIHIATEGPLGQAARACCIESGLAFTTAFHTRCPEFVAAAPGLPQGLGYAWLRRFHRPSSGVLVPALGTMAILERYRFANLRRWSHGIDLQRFRPLPGCDLGLPRPVFLYVGRVSYEKNLQAFLELDLPGSKVVCGGGPLLGRLKRRHPEVHWRGVVARESLVGIYNAADSFVYPSRTDTFGLVMLEALACGTPVAAYPTAGPLDVVGDSDGGVLDDDLGVAAMRSLAVPRERARARAATFEWDDVCRRFLGHLVPAVAPAQATLSEAMAMRGPWPRRPS